VKNNLNMESYLNNLNNFEHRKFLSKLRLSAHDFPIEKLRKQNVPRHKRYCEKCKSSDIGDEFHYLMRCPDFYLQGLRDEFIKKTAELVPQILFLPMRERFIYIVSCADMNCYKLLAPLLAKGMKYLAKCE